MDTASWVGFLLAHPPVWVWQVQHNTNMVKWLSDPTEAQKQAACFPNQAWQCTEPAQVGLGCVPRTRSEGSRVGGWRVGPSMELGRVQQGSLASGLCQPSWMCTRTCSGASANKLSQSGEQGERFLGWLEPSSVVPKLPAITQCPIPGKIQLTVLTSKHKSHKTVALAFLL